MKNVIEDAAYSFAVKKWQDLETSLMLVSEVLCNTNFALTLFRLEVLDNSDIQ